MPWQKTGLTKAEDKNMNQNTIGIDNELTRNTALGQAYLVRQTNQGSGDRCGQSIAGKQHKTDTWYKNASVQQGVEKPQNVTLT